MPKNATLTIAGVTTKPAPVIVEIPTPDALAARAIAGKTQDEILALFLAGNLATLDEAALWRAYMARIVARQARKSSRSAAA